MAKKVVYFVDDDEDICRMIRRLLERKGYDVESFLSGEDCYKSIQSSKCDLLITDWLMPGLNGIEFIKKVKKIRPELPSVVVTGSGTVKTVVASVKAGATHFIEKPFRIDEFIAVVENVLAKASRKMPINKINKPVSKAEKHVVKLILEGLTNKQVAERLNLAVRTVEDHRGSVMRKLGVDNIVDLVKITTKMDFEDSK